MRSESRHSSLRVRDGVAKIPMLSVADEEPAGAFDTESRIEILDFVEFRKRKHLVEKRLPCHTKSPSDVAPDERMRKHTSSSSNVQRPTPKPREGRRGDKVWDVVKGRYNQCPQKDSSPLPASQDRDSRHRQRSRHIVFAVPSPMNPEPVVYSFLPGPAPRLLFASSVARFDGRFLAKEEKGELCQKEEIPTGRRRRGTLQSNRI